MIASPLLIKAILALASDKRTWKGIGIIAASILTPLLLIAVVLCSMLYGTASHNNAAVDLTFNGGVIPASMPAEYREYITEMRSCFSSLDSAIAEVKMKKIEIVLTFSEEKLEALEFSLRKERSSVQKKMDEALKNLYEQTVPEAVREYLDRKDAPVRERPRRPPRQQEEAIPSFPEDGSEST